MIMEAFTEYDGLVETYRARIEALGLTYAAVDDLAGFQSGYTAKLLGPTQPKRIGQMSFGVLNQVLAIKFTAVVDAEAAAKIGARWEKRVRAKQDASKQAYIGKTTIRRVFPVVMKEFAKRGGDARAHGMTPEERSEHARAIACARWVKARKAKKLSAAAALLASATPRQARPIVVVDNPTPQHSPSKRRAASKPRLISILPTV